MSQLYPSIGPEKTVSPVSSFTMSNVAFEELDGPHRLSLTITNDSSGHGYIHEPSTSYSEYGLKFHAFESIQPI